MELWRGGFLGCFRKNFVAVGKMCQTKHCLMRGLEKVFDPQNVVKIIAFLEPRRDTASGYQYLAQLFFVLGQWCLKDFTLKLLQLLQNLLASTPRVDPHAGFWVQRLMVINLSALILAWVLIKKSLNILAYEVIDATLYLYTFGSHEKFYRDLKEYLQH